MTQAHSFEFEIDRTYLADVVRASSPVVLSAHGAMLAWKLLESGPGTPNR